MKLQTLFGTFSANLLASLSDFATKFDKSFIYNGRWQLYLKGLLTTFEVTVIALTIGIILGILVAAARTFHDQQPLGRRNPILGLFNVICQIYTTVIRGTPMMVQLLILGFVVFKSSREFTMIGALGLGLNSGAYVAEIFRGGLMAVDKGQTEAGRSLGLNSIDTLRFVIIPQAFKSVLPSLGNEFITLFKDTALISVIAGQDLVYAAKAISAKTYDAMFPYVGIAVIYLIFVMIFSWAQGKLERSLRKSDRR